MKRKKKYFNSAYNFSLWCVFTALLMIGEGIMVYFVLTSSEEHRAGFVDALYFVTSCIILLFIIFLYNGYEYFGTVEILSDRLVFRALLHKTRIFYFTDIIDIGIDYGVISGLRHFYIYFGKEKVPPKYTHNITRLKYSKNIMRVQYRRNVFDALLEVLPQATLGKQLKKGESVIRLFHVDN